MKKLVVLLFALAFILIACGTPAPVIVVVTATPEKLLASSTTVSTITLRPTQTPIPTITPTPTQIPVTLFDVETALERGGWKRYPYYTIDNIESFAWTKENVYKRIYTYGDGSVRIEVLNTPSRLKDIEPRFEFLDTIFPADFMTQLRQENKTYDASVGKSVSGTPDWSFYPPEGAEWNEYVATFNASNVTIGSYKVRFELYLWHLTCPSEWGCYMSDFPGLEWTGDTAFTWYTIVISLPK